MEYRFKDHGSSKGAKEFKETSLTLPFILDL